MFSNVFTLFFCLHLTFDFVLALFRCTIKSCVTMMSSDEKKCLGNLPAVVQWVLSFETDSMYFRKYEFDDNIWGTVDFRLCCSKDI